MRAHKRARAERPLGLLVPPLQLFSSRSSEFLLTLSTEPGYLYFKEVKWILNSNNLSKVTAEGPFSVQTEERQKDLGRKHLDDGEVM